MSFEPEEWNKLNDVDKSVRYDSYMDWCGGVCYSVAENYDNKYCDNFDIQNLKNEDNLYKKLNSVLLNRFQFFIHLHQRLNNLLPFWTQWYNSVISFFVSFLTLSHSLQLFLDSLFLRQSHPVCLLNGLVVELRKSRKEVIVIRQIGFVFLVLLGFDPLV